jgi:hypothetical protein
VNRHTEIISSQITQVRGTSNGPRAMAVLMIRNPANRRSCLPVKFTPRQNPFYCALPYNDKAHTGHRREAPRVVPWFQEAYRGPAVSTCKGSMGRRFAKAIESLMRSGKTRDHSERTIGNMYLAMNVRNPI